MIFWLIVLIVIVIALLYSWTHEDPRQWPDDDPHDYYRH